MVCSHIVPLFLCPTMTLAGCNVAQRMAAERRTRENGYCKYTKDIVRDLALVFGDSEDTCPTWGSTCCYS